LLSHVFRAFRYRDFRILWFGACTSSVGTWMQKLAQSWLVLQISNSPFLLGLDAFLGEIPIFLFSLVGGAVADRMDRRYLLIASQVIQMSCAFTLAALFALDVVRVWHILCLSFLVGLAQAFGGPAYAALIPALVKADDLPNAIAMNSIQFNLARVIGPMLGGLALTRLGAAWCFALNGLSYLAVIASLVALRVRFRPAAGERSILASVKAGIAFIHRQASMLSLIGLAFSTTVLGVPVVVFLPVFARDVFHRGADVYTLLLSLSGAGSIAGALLVAGMSEHRHKGWAAVAGLITLGAAIAGFAMSRNLVASCAFLFVAGASLMVVFAMVTSLVQLLTRDDMRGRVMSVYNVAFRGGMPIGSLLTGMLVPIFSAPLVVGVAGVLLVLLGLYLMTGRHGIASL
jgi:MFS family permease